MKFGFVIDNRKCIGCHACSTACKSENEVPLGVNRTWVKYTETGRFPDNRRHFQVTRCNHCENPPCVAICPVTAMYQRTDGIVEFDKDVCIGCKACIQACPYDAIYIDPDTKTAAKCHYCAHRTDIGLEPACVVVCPEHAIIAGDMDDPTSEISKVLAKEDVTVRKPEQGTSPKLFYIEGHYASMVPTAAGAQPDKFMWADSRLDSAQYPPAEKPPVSKDRETRGGTSLAAHMVQVGYNAEHKAYWHWQVPAYILTKEVATGLFLLLWLVFGLIPETHPSLALWGSTLSVFATLVTTALLVFDLERPSRFLSILYRPQWRSWLARGAFVLVGFSTVSGLWMMAEWGGWLGLLPMDLVSSWREPLLWVGLPLAFMAAIYTAFLFGQAEGRDLWQQPMLPIVLLVRTILAGSVCLMAIMPFVSGGPSGDQVETVVRTVFAISLLTSLILTFAGEVAMPHGSDVAAKAAKDIVKGRYRKHFWWGFLGLGHLLPLALLPLGFAGIQWLLAAAVLTGLFLMELAFVAAPQRVPNS